MSTEKSQIAFRYRPRNTRSGVTRSTAKKMAKVLGVGETQVIHMALYELSIKVLPQYDQDDGPLTQEQVNEIQALAPSPKGEVIVESLFDMVEVK